MFARLALIASTSVFAPSLSTATAQVVVNEILAKNGLSSVDGDSDSSDWIELHNAGSGPLNVEGYWLSDDPNVPQKWRVPRLLMPAGSYRLIWCSGKDRSESELHTNFKLKSTGEVIILSTPSGPIADAVSFPSQVADQSYGRSPDGRGRFSYFRRPTPGAENRGAASSRTFVVAPVQFSPAHGILEERVMVQLRSKTKDAKIRFTVDGSQPTLKNGHTYRRPFRISRSTVLRAKGYLHGSSPSESRTQSYIFPKDVLGPESTSVYAPGLSEHLG